APRMTVLRRLAGLTFALLLVTTARAQQPSELGWCANDAAASPALQIKDCTRVIQSGKATPANLVLALTIRGRACGAVGAHAEALRDLDAPSAAEPNAAAFLLRGAVHGKRREFDLAIADYDAALKIDPKLATAVSDRGFAYAGKGDFNRAIADYTQAIQMDPGLAVAFYNRGNARTATGDTRGALAD